MVGVAIPGLVVLDSLRNQAAPSTHPHPHHQCLRQVGGLALSPTNCTTQERRPYPST